jgi:hypothetical protein
MKRYTHAPAHPDVVAGLNDAAVLAQLAERIDTLIPEPRTHTAQQALITARVALLAAVKELTP